MSSGIQSLLKTEKDAAQIVNEARKYRTERLKSAKTDAQAEIDEYKRQREDELKSYEKENDGLNASIDKDADTVVEKELASIKQTYQEKKNAVVKLVVDGAVHPNPEIHINAE